MSNITQFTTGGVKSVQYGTWISPHTTTNNIAITISAVNPAKCMVIINGGYHYSQNNIFAEFISLTATVLTVYGPCYYSSPSWYGNQATWQVVEYY